MRLRRRGGGRRGIEGDGEVEEEEEEEADGKEKQEAEEVPTPELPRYNSWRWRSRHLVSCIASHIAQLSRLQFLLGGRQSFLEVSGVPRRAPGVPGGFRKPKMAKNVQEPRSSNPDPRGPRHDSCPGEVLTPCPGPDLNAVLLDFGPRFVFRYGREVREKGQNETKNKTKMKRKTPLRSGPGPTPSPR